jgi:hypothetical protein
MNKLVREGREKDKRKRKEKNDSREIKNMP